jgi:hypothetical protein
MYVDSFYQIDPISFWDKINVNHKKKTGENKWCWIKRAMECKMAISPSNQQAEKIDQNTVERLTREQKLIFSTNGFSICWKK